MTPEFDLIARHFTRPARRAVLGVGDDCALVNITAGQELAISTDTLVCGVHFFADADPFRLGHKALAVNLSDLAAMGASPRFVTLALTLPDVDAEWLEGFSRGFFALADAHDIELIGGDTTRGPLSMTLTVMGEVPPGKSLRRDAAKDGDDIWVSGSLGGAALALRHLLGEQVLNAVIAERALERLHTPQPRVSLGKALVGVAHAAIDLSDGLLADLSHICERSRLAADIEWASIPLSPALLSVTPDIRMACALAGGDDYELCFTAAAEARAEIETIALTTGVALTRIGSMHAARDNHFCARVIDERGAPVELGKTGFDHFAPTSS